MHNGTILVDVPEEAEPRLSLYNVHDSDVEEFQQQLDRLRVVARNIQETEKIDFSRSIDEIGQIGAQVKYSQHLLIKEIRRLKQDLDVNYARLNYANELQTIDQTTLQMFQTKFQDLTKILTDVKNRETNTGHLVQILRVNTSRLWHILEAAVGATIAQELAYEDLRALTDLAQTEKDERMTGQILLEAQHGELLIKLKEIELSLEHFRTLILTIKQNTHEIKQQINHQQGENDRLHDQASNRLVHLRMHTEDVRTLLTDYKLVTNEMSTVLKLIFQNQTQIEIFHKSLLLYEIKVEKYKQDIAVARADRNDIDTHIENLQRSMLNQTSKLKEFEYRQMQMSKSRENLRRRIQILEVEKNRTLYQQQQLLEEIKTATIENVAREKEAARLNHAVKDAQHSYHQFIKDHTRQQETTKKLQKIIQTNEQRLQTTIVEISQLTGEVKQQNSRLHGEEIRIAVQTKEIHDLETCGTTTHEELSIQRTKTEQNRTEVKLLTHRIHKLLTDEEPLAKEVFRYQKQVAQNELTHAQAKLELKQNVTSVNQYKMLISRVMVDLKQNDNVLGQEQSNLQRCHRQIETTKQNLSQLTDDLKRREFTQQDLRELFVHVQNENDNLRRHYANALLQLQVLGQQQSKLNNELKPLYGRTKHFTEEHFGRVKMIDQSKSDLILLRKYFLHLRTYNRELRQSLSLASIYDHELVESQQTYRGLSHIQSELELETKKESFIHYWQTLRIGSPEKFNEIFKLFAIKKKLVGKSNQLNRLKKIFREKEILYQYLSKIHTRRQTLAHRIDTRRAFAQKQIEGEIQTRKKCRQTVIKKE